MVLALALLAGAAWTGFAQPAPAAVQAVFLSDIHFEPFWDPAKVPELAAAPAAKWQAILEQPAGSDRQTKFDALQRACHVRGSDTSYGLLRSSLNAMKADVAKSSFVTLSGDLLAHGFDCKFKAVFPNGTEQEFGWFAEKTIRFVLDQLNQTAGHVPVYAALGNNDSDCGDYRVDAHSAFLADVGKDVVERFPERERAEALASFSAHGSYSIALPAPMENTRLIVLDDIFSSAKHTSCAGKPDTAGEDEEIAWLAKEIAASRAAKQRVWVMAHIPPGVDAFATLSRLNGACTQGPRMLLSSNKLGDALTDASDVITLGIFGHTHEDEIKLLEKQGFAGKAAAGPTASGIPVKVVASISPVNGNLPSFTIAEIDPATATLVDYKLVAGSEMVKWAGRYDYTEAYGESSFTAAAVKDLVAKFAGDSASKTKASQNYIHSFSTGNPIPFLSLVWPKYVCTMADQSASEFTQCACSRGK
jgi:sphingomyelin phosphodiesterase acid-like 3